MAKWLIGAIIHDQLNSLQNQLNQMLKKYIIYLYLPLLAFLTSCSDNSTPAAIERKESSYHKYAAKKIGDNSLQQHLQSEIIEKPLMDSNNEKDVYQQDEKLLESPANNQEEPFDLASLENPPHETGLTNKDSSSFKLENPLQSPKFIWPASGNIISRFGLAGGKAKEGITIELPKGTPVKASSDGTVIFVGNDQVYGELVIISHPDNLFTAYAHNSKIFVIKGQKVGKGSIIANSGSSGEASTPQLYFSVRKGSQTIDPELPLA